MSARRKAGRRAPAAVLVLALTAGALAGAPASASTITTNCAGLQAAFDNSDPNDVVVLTQMCVGQSFVLPGHRIVFRGQPGAGLDGTGAPSQLLSGGMNIGTTLIRDLTFRDAPFGALDLGAAPQIINNRFFNNTWPGADGGAVAVAQDTPLGVGIVIRGNVFGGTTPASGNSGDSGGALNAISSHAITVENNVFRNNEGHTGGAAFLSANPPGATVTVRGNTFSANTTEGLGGALYVNLRGTTRLVGNVFRNNTAGPDVGVGSGGGAVAVGSINDGDTLVQTNNLFIGNRVLVGDPADRNSGGAQYIINPREATIRITNDRYIDNAIVGEAGTGGGLFIRQGDLIGTVNVTLTNTVFAGNSIGINSQGGGIYAEENCAGECETNWTIKNSTIAGNQGGTGSAGIQMHGEADNNLVVHNSIIYGNGMPNEVTGFGTMAFSYSDVCGMGGAPLPGAGNICKPPRLANAAAGNVHQTRRSPTRDKGSNALVPSALKSDYEGDARIIDTDKNGTKRVDMGADERRAIAAISIAISRGSVIVSGAVRPNNRGKRVAVTLSRLRNGRFRSLATKRDRLNRRSRYSVRFADPAPGTCRVKVVFPGSLTTFPGTKTKRFSC